MKRYTTIIKFAMILAICFTSLLSLAGCGTAGKPENMSNQHYKYGKQAVEIADRYFDFEISADEAYRLITELTARKDELPDTETGDKTHLNDLLVETSVDLLQHSLMNAKYSLADNPYDSVLKDRNSLAEDLGMKTR